jgi:translation initiation factor 3 subunit B
MHWQSEGDFLCLLVTKVTKSGKKGATNLEIFRIREKSYPVDIVEVRDTVKAFNWETAGSRFSVITTDDTGHKPKLLFYVLGAEKCEMVQSLDLPSNSFTDVFWAPGGQYFVCAALGSSSSGDLLFGGLMPDNKVEILHKEEHFMLTNVAWDPSSRYVITAVTQAMKDDCGFKYQMEAGYAIWTFQGRKLVGTIQKEKLFAIQWRPHPPSLLDEKKQAYIRKNIKQFSKKYDALDEQAKEQQRSAFNADRDAKRNAFFDILERINEHKEDKWEQNGWADALDELSAQQVWDKHEEVMEEVLDTTEELIQ